MKPIAILEKLIYLLLTPLFTRIQRAPTCQARQIQFHLCAEFIGLLPFRMGMLARRVFYTHILPHCGSNPVIRMGTVIVHPQTEIGDNVLLGTRCVIGLASIGDGVMLGHHVSILSGRHHHKHSTNGATLQDGEITRVSIGRNVWIGAGAMVMADVGDNAIIGAGAVVVKPVPATATVVGNPARVVKMAEVMS